ncbi:uncharacterized protein TNIN_215811 [Trichonephila inaurata madagascariensis]|uniref:Reverse transcriptase/retrotransposon-derived protein RNase H-like domain-containing protein n=1 Tax=Trichonephila inaurata madagascariensis TaxID=2747483 RepID=A0A8X6Y579_9ARAC|nr:uncharacterized protein TNIN_215811 [Trichonephila inaurata madagascariensis]
MKELSGGQLQDEFLKKIWLQRLPSQIQTVLSVSSETLNKLAENADKVADVALPAAVYSATSAPELNTSAEIQELAKQIVELKLQISRGPEINHSFVRSHRRAREIGIEQQTMRLFVFITNVIVRTPATVSHLATSNIANLVIDLALSRKTRKHDYSGIKTLAASLASEYSAILRDFPDLTRPRPFNEKIKHNTFHCIETFGPPVHARARKLNPQQSEAAKQEFQYMLDQGIIIPSKSNWCSPLHMVSKYDTKLWRPCGDYRALNKQTRPDRYSIPNLTNFNENLKANVTVLAHPSQDADLALMTDASDFGLGASLNEITSDSFKPLGFFSKKLAPAQTKYSAFDRELAAYSAIKISAIVTPSTIDYEEFAQMQQGDDELKALLSATNQTLQLKQLRMPGSTTEIYCDISMGIALEITMESIKVAATGPTTSQHHPMSCLCLENRQICFALIELLTTIINEQVYSLLKLQNKLDLLDYLLCYIEKPPDRNIRVEALKLMTRLITLNNKFCISLPDELKEKTVDLLLRKVMSKEEPIAIESLSVVGAILDGDGNQFWKEIIFRKNIHQIVWEMGVDGVHSDMLKSSSLRTAFKVYKVPYFWEDIKSAKKVDEIAVLKILLYYFHDHGYYTQTKACLCICELLADDKIPASYLDYVFTVFLKSVDYCGRDRSSKVFDSWLELIKSSKYFPDAMQSTDNLLKAVCNSGFAAALVLALQDRWSGEEKAARILKKFREILLQMGYTKDSVALEDVRVIIPPKMNYPKTVLDPAKKAERKALIKKVSRLSTAEQIGMLAPPPKPAYSDMFLDDIALQKVDLSYPVNSFLKCVWSDKVDSVLAGDTRRPLHLFSDFAWSVLDDIILSKGIEKPLKMQASSTSDSSSDSDDWSKDGPDCY